MSLYIFDRSEQLQIVINETAAAAGQNLLYYTDPIHTEDTEGLNLFEFKIPADHSDAQYIKENYLVAFKDPDGIYQLFEIKEIKENHTSAGLMKVFYCEHAYYEILDEIIEDVRPGSCSAAFALGQALGGSTWQAGTVDNLGTQTTNFYYESRKSALNKIRETWGGEIRPRVVLTDPQAIDTKEETDPAIVYSGSWTAESNAVYSGGTGKYSGTVGASATITFVGTGIKVLGIKNSYSGIGKFTLDGGTPGNIDLYSIAQKPKTTIYEIQGLAYGTHTLKIEPTGTKNAAAANYYVILDYFEITRGVILTKYIDLLTRRGSDTGKIFEYTKDLLEVERYTNSKNLITAAYGRGKGEAVGETTDGTTYGRRTTFKDIVWTVAGGNAADKPAGQEWIGDPAALAAWGRKGRHRVGIFKDDEETDPATLLTNTWNYIQANNKPKNTYTLKVQDLERLTGYSHEAVRLGDGIHAIDKEFSPALYLDARIIKIERNLLDPTNTIVTLGNYIEDLASSSTDQSQAIDDFRDRQGIYDKLGAGHVSTAWLEGQISALQNQINAGGGTVTVTDTDGILIVDNAAAPTKALRLIGGALAIANSKTGAAWNWRSFGTGDGFTANEMKTGKLTGGKLSFDLDNGILKVLDSTGAFNMAQFTASQIIFGKTAGQQFIVNADGSVTTPIITANKIVGGTLTLGGASNGSGLFSLKNASNVEIVKMDNTGILITGGSFRIQDTIDAGKWVYGAGAGLGSWLDLLITKVEGVATNATASGAEGVPIYDIFQLTKDGMWSGSYLGTTITPQNKKVVQFKWWAGGTTLTLGNGQSQILTSAIGVLTSTDGIAIDGGSAMNVNSPAIKITSASVLDFARGFTVGAGASITSAGVVKATYLDLITEAVNNRVVIRCTGASAVNGVTFWNPYTSALMGLNIATSVIGGITVGNNNELNSGSQMYINYRNGGSGLQVCNGAGSLGPIYGSTKSAIVETENYGQQILYCDESPNHVFSDRGKGVFDGNGLCYIFIDPILLDTIATKLTDYFVYLTSFNGANAEILELQPEYFVISGTPGKEFFWILTAERKGMERLRFNDADIII